MNKKNFFKFIIVISLITFIFFIAKDMKLKYYLENPSSIVDYIKQFEVLAPIIFILLYILRTFLFVFPAAIFTIISSSIFGIIPGFIYSMIGAFCSASVAFFIGRYFARDFVKKHLSNKIHLLKDKHINGFRIVLYLRIIMIMPFDGFGFATGTSKISYKDFILGTMLGIIPEFLIYVYLGKGLISEITFIQKIIISTVSIGILLIGHGIKKKVIEHIKH